MPDQLPREIRARIADAQTHFRALVLALEEISAADYAAALESRDAEALVRHVYPIERPFEILDNYVIELAWHGLAAAGKDPTGAATTALKRLHDLGVVSRARLDRLRGVNLRRNELQHEYPDARAALVYEAARVLAADLPGFFRDYARWLRKLGFGEQA